MWYLIKNGFIILYILPMLVNCSISIYYITISQYLIFYIIRNAKIPEAYWWKYNLKCIIMLKTWYDLSLGGGVYENYYDILFSASWWQALFSWFKKMIRFWVDGRGVMKVILILEPFDDRRCFDDPVSLHYNLHANQDCVSFPFWQ